MIIEQKETPLSAIDPMNGAILAQPSKTFAIDVEDNARQTPQDGQTHIKHKRFHVPARNDPRCNKLAEPISTQLNSMLANPVVSIAGIGKTLTFLFTIIETNILPAAGL